jgi:hypothetical protein
MRHPKTEIGIVWEAEKDLVGRTGRQTVLGFTLERTEETLTAHGRLALLVEFSHGLGDCGVADRLLPGSGSNHRYALPERAHEGHYLTPGVRRISQAPFMVRCNVNMTPETHSYGGGAGGGSHLSNDALLVLHSQDMRGEGQLQKSSVLKEPPQ